MKMPRVGGIAFPVGLEERAKGVGLETLEAGAEDGLCKTDFFWSGVCGLANDSMSESYSSVVSPISAAPRC